MRIRIKNYSLSVYRLPFFRQVVSGYVSNDRLSYVLSFNIKGLNIRFTKWRKLYEQKHYHDKGI